MRKFFFFSLLMLSLFSLQSLQAQSKIGIKFAPTLSTNRVDFTGNNYSVSSNGVGGRFIFGPIFDLFITDNYYFSTGILFAPKRIGVTVIDRNGAQPISSEQAYNLQYIQLPATLKLFTNELALDTRVYFQLGGLLEFKIASGAQEDYPLKYINETRLFDLGIHLGSGVEYRLGYNTLLFGGIFYNRGLTNAVTSATPEGLEIDLKNDLVGLELGIKF